MYPFVDCYVTCMFLVRERQWNAPVLSRMVYVDGVSAIKQLQQENFVGQFVKTPKTTQMRT